MVCLSLKDPLSADNISFLNLILVKDGLLDFKTFLPVGIGKKTGYDSLNEGERCKSRVKLHQSLRTLRLRNRLQSCLNCHLSDLDMERKLKRLQRGNEEGRNLSAAGQLQGRVSDYRNGTQRLSAFGSPALQGTFATSESVKQKESFSALFWITVSAQRTFVAPP